MIELPKQEEIMDVMCGDKAFWATNSERNFAFIKPLGDKPGQSTNINLLTASGNVYSLIVHEVSRDPVGHADLKVFLEQGDSDSAVAMNSKPLYVRADQIEVLQKQLAESQKQLAQTKATAGQIELKDQVFDYVWPDNKAAKAFAVESMYHDKAGFHIKAHPAEAPALYEIKDNRPALTQYSLSDGIYTVPHVVDDGYLRIGKKTLSFHRRQAQS